MADIREKILDKYEIDIAQENIFKLYKIEKVDFSDSELQQAIDATRKRWNQSVNGTNEKFAERDRKRLENADKYETILRNIKLRKEVFRFYNSGDGTKKKTTGAGSAEVASTEFAREYFKLVATTKKIRKQDVDFFFEYYKAQRKNKKAVLEMLSKEFKIRGLGKESEYADPNSDKEEEGKKKDSSSPLIVNFFQKATILKIRACMDHYELAVKSDVVCRKYPMLREGIFEFLEMKNMRSVEQFSEMVSQKAKEVFAVRQEQGTEFMPLVDLFNTLKILVEYQDVYDNFMEFKLLIQYPNLTPYMYSFVEMKSSTLKGIVNIARREYAFRDNTDFLLNYYISIYDNFGISNNGISSIINKAKKKTKQNKILTMVDQKLRKNRKNKMPIGVDIMHGLVYWPIFLLYFIFELSKIIFTKLHKVIIPIFLAAFLWANWMFPKIFYIENMLVFTKIVSKKEWCTFLEKFLGNVNNPFDVIILTIIALIVLVTVYVLPALFTTFFIMEFSDDFNKRFDWEGLERTFQNIFQRLRNKKEDLYNKHKKLFYKRAVGKACINIGCLAVLAFITYKLYRGWY